MERRISNHGVDSVGAAGSWMPHSTLILRDFFVFCAHVFGGSFSANDKIADCGLAIADYQPQGMVDRQGRVLLGTESVSASSIRNPQSEIRNPKSAIWLRLSAALGCQRNGHRMERYLVGR
jgi:hypothetical protein